jgi:hypothetical protein
LTSSLAASCIWQPELAVASRERGNHSEHLTLLPSSSGCSGHRACHSGADCRSYHLSRLSVSTHSSSNTSINTSSNTSTSLQERRRLTRDGGVETAQNGVHVVVGTPGRVYDMLRRRALRPDYIKAFVLDEADEMLSRGFKDQIYDIFQLLPSTLQVRVGSVGGGGGRRALRVAVRR